MFSWSVSLGDVVMVLVVVVGMVIQWDRVQARLCAIETWIKDHRNRHDRFDREFDNMRIRFERHEAKANSEKAK